MVFLYKLIGEFGTEKDYRYINGESLINFANNFVNLMISNCPHNFTIQAFETNTPEDYELLNIELRTEEEIKQIMEAQE